MALLSSLDQIAVDVPCEVPWNSMTGDERVRFCDKCQQKVYNIAAMSTAEALALVESAQPSCVRILRRSDGTVVTRDCRKLLRAIRRRLAAGYSLAGALVLGILTVTGLAGGRTNRDHRAEPLDSLSFWALLARPQPPPAVAGKPQAVAGNLLRPPPMTGNVAMPPATSAPPCNPPAAGS